MNQFEINDIFPSPIFVKDLNIDNVPLERYALQLKDEDQGNVKSNRGGFQSDDLPFEKEEILHPIYNEIINSSNQFKEYIGFKKNMYSEMNNMWLNVNGSRDYNASHVHPGATFSGVYYVNAPKDSGNICFENPSANVMQYDWLDGYKDDFNRINSEVFYYTAITGRLILFPSWLRHSVTSNYSNKYRISLSFNTSIFYE